MLSQRTHQTDPELVFRGVSSTLWEMGKPGGGEWRSDPGRNLQYSDAVHCGVDNRPSCLDRLGIRVKAYRLHGTRKVAVEDKVHSSLKTRLAFYLSEAHADLAWVVIV